MQILNIYNSDFFTWIILPLLLFASRLLDVSLGTIRIIYIARGMKFLAPMIGFLEVIVWLMAMGLIMQNLSSPIHYLAYAGGFAIGNLVGIILEEKLAFGKVTIRIIMPKVYPCIVKKQLISNGYNVTVINAEDSKGPVVIIFTIINRKEIEKVINLIQLIEPNIFFTIEDIKSVRK